MSLKECADAVYLWEVGTDITDADTDKTTSYNDIKEQLRSITELKDMIHKQNELI